MLTKAYLGAALLVAIPAFPQAVSPLNPAPAPEDSRMATPPPVSGEAYPTEVGAESRSNYLSGGISFSASYVDNLYPGSGGVIAARTYSILPTLNLDQSTPRRHLTIMYSPGFTFYDPTSALNQVDHAANLLYRVRPSPHSVLAFNDQFRYSSTGFGSLGAGATGVSGSAPVIAPGIVAPFAKQLTNAGDAGFTLQTGLNSMFGLLGTASTLHYPNPTQVTGLYDSSSRGASGFYNHRIFEGQYLGATYNYAQVFAYPASTRVEDRIQSASVFYTIYVKRLLTFSISGGPQQSQQLQQSLSTLSSWSPFVTASAGWQGLHTSLAASYAQSVTAGGGLVGAYHSRTGNASARWQMSRTWTAGLSANYAINKSVTGASIFGSNNGHTISGSATVTHSIGRRANLAFEYDRIHQNYDGIPAISNNPDADRATASISWEFMRPIGR